MRGIAGPQTRLLVTTPNAYRLASFLNVLGRQETVHPDHIAVWSMPLLAALVAQNGWEPVEAAMYQVPTIRNASVKRSGGARGAIGAIARRTADHLVSRGTPYLADGLILVAQPATTEPAARSQGRRHNGS
jgi:hypothetical protein